MQLPSHGRCGYSAIVNRADYSWPEGKRLAIYVAAALEHFAFGRGMGHPASAQNPPADHRALA